MASNARKFGRKSGWRPSRSRGFTLVELMITLVVAAILLAIAVPSFKYLTISNKLTTTANQIVGALSTARMEAIKRNRDTQFCSNNSGNNGGDALGNACGIRAAAVYAINASGTVDQVLDAVQVPSAIELGTGGNGASALTSLRFKPNGLGQPPGGGAPYTGLVADVLSNEISSNNHRCIYLTTGSTVTTCTVTTATNAANGCPANVPNPCQQ